jgi:hypothetical protein
MSRDCFGSDFAKKEEELNESQQYKSRFWFWRFNDGRQGGGERRRKRRRTDYLEKIVPLCSKRTNDEKGLKGGEEEEW